MDQHPDHQPTDMIPESTNMTDLSYHPTTRTPHRAYHPYARTDTDNHLNGRAPQTASNPNGRAPRTASNPNSSAPRTASNPNGRYARIAVNTTQHTITQQPELPTQPSRLSTQPVIPRPELPTQSVTPQPELHTLPVISQSVLHIQPVIPSTQLSTPPPSLPTEFNDILNTLPSVYTDDLSTLFTVLTPDWVNLFTRIFTQVITRLPPALPSELTSSSLDMSILPPNFPALFSKFKNTVMLMIIIQCARSAVKNLFRRFPDTSTSQMNNFQLNIIIQDITPFKIICMINAVINSSSPNPSSVWEQKLVDLFKDLFYHLCYVLHALVVMLNAALNEDNGHTELVRLQTLINNLWRDIDILMDLNVPDMVNPLPELDEDPDAEFFDIENLTFQYVHQTRADVKTDADKCTVCLQDMKDGDNARRLRCLHAFHKDCIDHWLEEKNTCPMCRTHINATHEIESTLNAPCSSDC